MTASRASDLVAIFGGLLLLFIAISVVATFITIKILNYIERRDNANSSED